jgi:hypothetical protein
MQNRQLFLIFKASFVIYDSVLDDSVKIETLISSSSTNFSQDVMPDIEKKVCILIFNAAANEF